MPDSTDVAAKKDEPKPEPKKKWHQKLLDALGTAVGEWFMRR